ncbi:hypothetical protein G6F24_017021 [Rhizopus arrhizus]|nr:hypothetical protein G6F24_017021 [Rhizopus arrhizus]
MRVRFRNSLSLGFPATELSAEGEVYSLKGERLLDREAVEQARHGEELAEVHLTPHCASSTNATGPHGRSWTSSPPVRCHCITPPGRNIAWRCSTSWIAVSASCRWCCRCWAWA